MLVTPDKVMDIKEMQGWLSLSQWVAFWCSISCQVIIPQQMKRMRQGVGLCLLSTTIVVRV
jgi:hypothetical protein